LETSVTYAKFFGSFHAKLF